MLGYFEIFVVVLGCFDTFWDVFRLFRRFVVFWDVVGHFEMFWKALRFFGSLTNHYFAKSAFAF